MEPLVEHAAAEYSRLQLVAHLAEPVQCVYFIAARLDDGALEGNAFEFGGRESSDERGETGVD